jgi:hypothetical protein
MERHRKPDLSFLDDDPNLRGGREEKPRHGPGALAFSRDNIYQIPDGLAGENLARFLARRRDAYARIIRQGMIEDEKINPPGRGVPKRVVRCDGTQYPTITAAARAPDIQTKADNICQAIPRNGRCAGWRWAYASAIPAGFFDWQDGDPHCVNEAGYCRTCGQPDDCDKCPGPNRNHHHHEANSDNGHHLTA